MDANENEINEIEEPVVANFEEPMATFFVAEPALQTVGEGTSGGASSGEGGSDKDPGNFF